MRLNQQTMECKLAENQIDFNPLNSLPPPGPDTYMKLTLCVIGLVCNSLGLTYMIAKSVLNSCFSQLVVSVALADVTYMAMESYVQLVVMEKVSSMQIYS